MKAKDTILIEATVYRVFRNTVIVLIWDGTKYKLVSVSKDEVRKSNN